MQKTTLLIILILFCACKSDKNTTNSKSEEPQKDLITNPIMAEIEHDLPLVDDSLFFIFFELFMWNAEFQKSRIVFPFQKENVQILKAENWEYLPFYTENDFIPVLQSDSINLNDRQIAESKIGLHVLNANLTTGIRYDFEKKDKKWFLLNATSVSIQEVPDFEFLEFLTTFSKDTIYQISHISFPLSQSVSDYDNNYETLETAVLKEDWQHIPLADYLENLMVLSDLDETSKYRIIVFKGIENGISVKYTFNKINGQWMLTHHEDLST
uniref:DUF4348 domain-containing protein n=1 Tax=Flavobacterium sp. TaxID=239 RepID=UPI004049E7BE